MEGNGRFLIEKEQNKGKQETTMERYVNTDRSRGLVITGKREELLVHLTPFIDIRVQVNFRGLDRSMAQVLLNDTEVL